MTVLDGPGAIAFAQGVLESQPFSVLVGARVEAMSPSGVVVRVPFRRDLTQHHGFAHGGVQAVTRCDIFAVQNGEEKLVAPALGTIVTADAPPAGGNG